MFDIGFSEMVVIAVVALIVIGPERLPKVARTAGHLLGRLQRYVGGIKSDISRDMALDELRQTQQQVQQEVDSAAQAVGQTVQQLDQHLQQLDTAPPASTKTYTEQILRAREPAAPEIKPPEQQRFPID